MRISVRAKMIMAFVVAAGALIAVIKLFTPVAANKALFFSSLGVIVVGLFAYAARLKCPHCHGRAFSLRWLMLAYVPGACATCDRDLFLD